MLTTTAEEVCVCPCVCDGEEDCTWMFLIFPPPSIPVGHLHRSRSMDCSLLTNHPKLIAAFALPLKWLLTLIVSSLLLRKRSAMNYRFYSYPYIILRWQGQGMESMICLSVFRLFVCVCKNGIRESCVCTTGGYRHTGTWLGHTGSVLFFSYFSWLHQYGLSLTHPSSLTTHGV